MFANGLTTVTGAAAPVILDEAEASLNKREASERAPLLAEVDAPSISSPTFLQTAWDVSTFSAPFAISRVAVAVNVIVNGLVTPYIGPNAVAAGPEMISTVYAILGPGRAILLATGILVGKLQGEIKKLTEQGKMAEVEKRQKAIGRQLMQSFIFGTALGIPSIAIMVGMGPILQHVGMSPEVVSDIEGFLNGTAVGLMPIFWSTSDQQFAMGTGLKNLPMIFGTLFPVLSMAIGYPLALGLGGLPKLGTAGLGYGMSAAAWISFIALRLYFLKPEFKPYGIYKVPFETVFKDIGELLKLGLPLGYQALTEWGNLFALSQLLTDKDVAIAANGSFQMITAWTLVSAALGQGVSIKISNILGQMQVIANEPAALSSQNDLRVLDRNIRKVGNAGIVVGALATLLFSGAIIGGAQEIQSIFVSQDSPNYDQVMDMAKLMLIANAVGLIVDTIRNVAASGLAGSKDVMFAPTVSLLAMSFLALITGGLLTRYWDMDSNLLFITRNVGILLAASAIIHRWSNKDYMPKPNPEVRAVPEVRARREALCWSSANSGASAYSEIKYEA
jgi:Na+-driven multidrug efflux pump